jgi:HSP20 family protein
MALNRHFRHPFFSPGFDEFFSPVPIFATQDPFLNIMPVLANLDRASSDMSLMRSSPGYEIRESDKSYQIQVDVPGVKAADMEIKLESDQRVLHIAGGRKVTGEDGSVSQTHFEKRFTIGDNIEVEQLSARLEDGVLTLTAPKKVKKEPTVMKIAITEGGSDEKKLGITQSEEKKE